jgi:hypothetical protein
MTRLVATTYPLSDVPFARRVRETLAEHAWDLESEEGVALLEALLRVSYPVATIVSTSAVAPYGGIVVAQLLEIHRDGDSSPQRTSIAAFAATRPEQAEGPALGTASVALAARRSP